MDAFGISKETCKVDCAFKMEKSLWEQIVKRAEWADAPAAARESLKAVYTSGVPSACGHTSRIE